MGLQNAALSPNGIPHIATSNRSQQQQGISGQAGNQPRFGSLLRRYDLSSPSYDHYGGHRDTVSSTVSNVNLLPNVAQQYTPGGWTSRNHPADVPSPAFGSAHSIQSEDAACNASGTFPIAHSANVPMPATAVPAMNIALHPSGDTNQQLDQPIQVQLMSGEWITVAAIHATSSPPTLAQSLPVHHARGGPTLMPSVPQKPLA